jgi:hypothetical protein
MQVISSVSVSVFDTTVVDCKVEEDTLLCTS